MTYISKWTMLKLCCRTLKYNLQMRQKFDKRPSCSICLLKIHFSDNQKSDCVYIPIPLQCNSFYFHFQILQQQQHLERQKHLQQQQKEQNESSRPPTTSSPKRGFDIRSLLAEPVQSHHLNLAPTALVSSTQSTNNNPNLDFYAKMAARLFPSPFNPIFRQVLET